MKQIESIAIAGAGVMGRGIAIACLDAGYPVLIYDSDLSRADSAIEAVKSHFLKNIGKQTKTNVNRVTSARGLEDLRRADLIIEAVSENEEIKKNLFKKLGKICPASAIFASNTSTIPIKKLACAASRKENFIGMHFMNPAFLINLVEIIKTEDTSLETADLITQVVDKMGKTAVIVGDSPGFVMNRLLIPMINEAISCFSEGVAKIEDIDNVMKIGAGHPAGPLKLADLIGLDICLAIMRELERGFPKKNFKACELLEKMVKAGKLGRKTGQGFYRYQTK